MRFQLEAKLILDYGAVATPALLQNISGLAQDGDALWTVSDEGRSVECLTRVANGFRLQHQFELDALAGLDIPGSDQQAECDLESLDVRDGSLWLCGSHCLVRKKRGIDEMISEELRGRPSRCVLARVEILPGNKLGRARALPVDGEGSLRNALEADPYLAPFRHLPSKESGIDIEGFADLGTEQLVGLRGPVVDDFAVVARLKLDEHFKRTSHELAFLDLGGLGIRDLCRWRDGVLVLAGPVTAAEGPFRIQYWTPDKPLSRPETVFAWGVIDEKPEGLCPMDFGGKTGLLITYDSPDRRRLGKTTCSIDWLEEI